MQNLMLTEGSIIAVTNVKLPKGTFCKLRPRTSDFLDITDPKAVLENTLRHFACLTLGDQICINYCDKNYFIDIMELQPANAVSIIETDMEVDFAPPADYVEPERQPAAGGQAGTAATAGAPGSAADAAPDDAENAGFAAFSGQGQSLAGAQPTVRASPVLAGASPILPAELGGKIIALPGSDPSAKWALPAAAMSQPSTAGGSLVAGQAAATGQSAMSARSGPSPALRPVAFQGTSGGARLDGGVAPASTGAASGGTPAAPAGGVAFDLGGDSPEGGSGNAGFGAGSGMGSASNRFAQHIRKSTEGSSAASAGQTLGGGRTLGGGNTLGSK